MGVRTPFSSRRRRPHAWCGARGKQDYPQCVITINNAGQQGVPGMYCGAQQGMYCGALYMQRSTSPGLPVVQVLNARDDIGKRVATIEEKREL